MEENEGAKEEKFQGITQAALRQGKGWTNFLGWVLLISGILSCLTIVGAIVGWVGIWLGILLRRAAKRAEENIRTGDEKSLIGYLEEINQFFRLNGIVTLIAMGLGVLSLVIYMLIIIGLMLGMAGTNTLGERLEKQFDRSTTQATTIPDNFPRTYLALEDGGDYGKVLVWRSSKPTEVPILKDGKKYYDAYVCLNEKCPGRKITGGKPYIFAVVPPEEETEEGNLPKFPELYCPLCKEVFEKAPKAESGRYDPFNIERYQTPEAQAMIEKIRQAFLKKHAVRSY